MSLWGQRFHHTAKMPESIRVKALKNGYKMLDFLVTLRNQAIIYASSEDICIYASFVQLPPPTPDEAESLRESSSDEATTEHESDQEQGSDEEDPWDAQAAASAAAADELDAVDSPDAGSDEPTEEDDTGNDTGAAEKEAFDRDMVILAAAIASRPPPAESSTSSNAAEASTIDTTTAESSVATKQFLTNGPGSNEGSNSLSSDYESMEAETASPTDTEGTEGTNQEKWLTNTPGSPYSNEVTTSSNSGNSPSQADEGYVTAAQDDGDADADSDVEVKGSPARSNNIHFPFCMRPSTLFDTPPTWAEQYKKFFDKAVEAWRAFSHNRAPRPLRARLEDPRTHEAAVKRYNLINLGLYPCITVGHLIELKRRIGDAAHFCNWMQGNMREMDLDRDLRKDILNSYPSNSPLRLRTRGLGSSLRYATHVDEGWDDLEDNWGMPPLMKKRSRMQFHSSQNTTW
ncbi:hypothetical protein FGADI_2882 [Fusarium gaditjirri]|uniref:Uncharacterized protein n=1 Tax=Fusarium gaditjirri TaxID=282569 RepID=A0A8H4X0N8_9HYPO|nr:hypothetical protein FGADI_2882 [Fusarium gaditjirri]